MPLGDCNGRAAATGLLGVTRGRNLPHGQGRHSILNGPPLNMAAASGNAVRTTTYTKTRRGRRRHITYRNRTAQSDRVHQETVYPKLRTPGLTIPEVLMRLR
jgi:hypothetical protein